tara:strand:- start:188 stop:775 length:588 start_codon:yes stop_codon:yes gene_type:complete
MKTKIVHNLISPKELFHVYSSLITFQNWTVSGITKPLSYEASDNKGEEIFSEPKHLNYGPLLLVQSEDGFVHNPALMLYMQSLVYRLHSILEKEKIGIPTKIRRTWINGTYTGGNQHWPHRDDYKAHDKSVLIFLNPVWQNAWEGHFYIDGEKHLCTPGSAIIFDACEFHCGESSNSKSLNWLRLTANIILRENI